MDFFLLSHNLASDHVRGVARGNCLKFTSPPGNKALMGKAQIGRAPSVSVPECFLSMLYFYMFTNAIFL